LDPDPFSREPGAYTPKHLADKILTSRAALEGEHKQVTVLFADVKGSMDLAGRLDAEEWHGLLDRFFVILTEGVHRYEVTVNQYTGDGIMALFGAPIAHEDHAQRACYAALYVRDKLRAYADQLRIERGVSFGVRIGLNSGEVVVGRIGDDLRMDYTAQGHTVGLAQRMEQLAESGHVYISEHTRRFVEGYFQLRDLGASNMAGVDEPVGIFELEGVGASHTRIEVAKTRGLTRFVGRTHEMQALDAALARAKDGHGQVVGVVGEPGLGKSRLCFEFVERCRADGVPVYEAHCPAHGKNIPFIPILELFRNYFGITAQDTPAQARQKIAGTLLMLDPALQESLPVLFEFMGVGDPNRPAPALDAESRQRQLFAMLDPIYRAQREQGITTVALIDDLHWADPSSDAFIAQIAAATENARTLLLLNFRPEYQAEWMRRTHYQQLPLVPLGVDDLRELVESLLGVDPSLSDLGERIMRWTSGNPFYTEEVIQALVEAGHLEGRSGAYRLVTGVGQLEVPANVHAVLAARIDRLPETAKQMLQTASVIGKEFSRPLLETVADLPDRNSRADTRKPMQSSRGPSKNAKATISMSTRRCSPIIGKPRARAHGPQSGMNGRRNGRGSTTHPLPSGTGSGCANSSQSCRPTRRRWRSVRARARTA
jgi:class 3 adenylate cyclase